MTLRWRLTLLTSALIALMAILLGLAAFTAAQRVQLETVDRTLVAALANPRVRALETRLPNPSVDTAAVIGLARFIPLTGEVRVLQTAGTATDPIPFPTLTDEQLAAAAAEPISVSGSPAQRVAVREVRPGRLTVVAAFPLTDIEQAQRRLATGITISVALVSVLGAALAWLLVRRSLKPVDDIADAATAIAAGDLTIRIPEEKGGSEVAQLATALNTMITALTESLDQVQASEERLRRFVSDASHEIRTPLTVISGYAELLQRDVEGRDPMEVRAVTRIQTETERLERLVTQLLLLERLERGDRTDSTAFDLASVVADGLGDLCLGEPARPLDLDLTPTMIIGDPEDWRQVVANLAQNIERHTPAGSPVRAVLHEEQARIVLTVDDAGPGIPADQRAAVLSRFTRTDTSRSRGTGGFGLGMSIVARIVAAQGGVLELSDSPLGGLRVRIALPHLEG